MIGLLYLTAKASPERAGVQLAAEAVAGLAFIILVLSTSTGREVVEQRVGTATGESFYGRVEVWQETVEQLRRSPLVGIGASEMNVDNFVILHVTQARLIGAASSWSSAASPSGSASPSATQSYGSPFCWPSWRAGCSRTPSGRPWSPGSSALCSVCPR